MSQALSPSLSVAVPSLSLSPSFSFLPSFSLSFWFSPSFLPWNVTHSTGKCTQNKSAHSAVTVRICIIVRSHKNLHTCKLPLAGSRSPLIKYARGSHIGFRSTSQTRSCALRMPRYVTFTGCYVRSWSYYWRRSFSTNVLKKHNIFYTSEIPEVMWYKPLYNIYLVDYLTSVIHLYTVKWSNSSISNNPIYCKSLVCTQFTCQTVLFDPLLGPYQLLPLWARVDLGAMARKGCFAFSIARALLEPHHQIV